MPATLTERPEAVTLKGNPKTLVGDALKVGDTAPDFTLKANDMSDKTLTDYEGKVKIVVTVPSLDTPVCDTEARKFNEHAAALGDDFAVLIVSIDLPMAQKRWCGAAGVANVETLSDYLTGDFGRAYGVKIKEIGLLARSIIIVDADNKIAYTQLVKEVAEEPDYDAALQAAKDAA